MMPDDCHLPAICLRRAGAARRARPHSMTGPTCNVATCLGTWEATVNRNKTIKYNICIYTYIYRERDIQPLIYIYTCWYIYIYICIHIDPYACIYIYMYYIIIITLIAPLKRIGHGDWLRAAGRADGRWGTDPHLFSGVWVGAWEGWSVCGRVGERVGGL